MGVFDVVRGFSVVSMVLFHLCYDLRFLAGVPLAWFAPPLQDVWRASISWTFLFVAGCMCPLSRSNLRRGLSYAAVALAIWVVTTVAAVDTPISFGIIYCMAACTLVSWALSRVGALPRGRVAALVLFVAFLALQGISRGTVGLGPLSVELPPALYETPWLAWLGLPGGGFSSGDYYPLLPYLFMYLAGAALGARWGQRGYPAWAREAHVAPLSFVGRHALVVYVVHQPVLLALTMLLA
ncbi:DUF1624 domain-containing protein [Olsenella profusa]|uniref:DUF1624 domain-containing protein n=1 Tax=Olsenella profusa TaxID=138595 RepID=A0ABS2F398_9ACTN|nr:DUF1624 domain-containing protein [Olsenella profusa]